MRLIFPLFINTIWVGARRIGRPEFQLDCLDGSYLTRGETCRGKIIEWPTVGYRVTGKVQYYYTWSTDAGENFKIKRRNFRPRRRYEFPRTTILSQILLGSVSFANVVAKEFASSGNDKRWNTVSEYRLVAIFVVRKRRTIYAGINRQPFTPSSKVHDCDYRVLQDISAVRSTVISTYTRL